LYIPSERDLITVIPSYITRLSKTVSLLEEIYDGA